MTFKKILKVVSILSVLGIMAPNFSLALNKVRAPREAQWQYFKDIDINDNPQKGDLVKITLDQDIFNNAQENLGDLRIVADDLFDVPYKLIVEQSVFSQENIYSIRVLNNSFNTDGQYNIFIIDFGQSGFLNSSLNIFTGSENFKRTVEISGSNNMASWSVLKTNGHIFDYTNKMANFNARNTAVDYPENSFRYIQVKIFTGGEAPLAINSAQVSKITKKESRETVFNPVYEIKENSAKKLTEVIIDLGKKGWPTFSITLVSPDENFNRETVVYESGDKNNWKMAGQSYIFNYNTPKFVGANSEVNYRETNKRYLKLEIFNGDNKPINISKVSVKTILRSIAFQYGYGSNAIDSAYKLYYGNPKANFPEYDLEKFFPYLDTGKYFGSNLSAEQVNSDYQKETSPVPPLTERIPYFVPGVLVLAISMMGLMVFKFMKKVGSEK